MGVSDWNKAVEWTAPDASIDFFDPCRLQTYLPVVVQIVMAVSVEHQHLPIPQDCPQELRYAVLDWRKSELVAPLKETTSPVF